MNVIQRAGITSEHTNRNPGEGSAGFHRKKKNGLGSHDPATNEYVRVIWLYVSFYIISPLLLRFRRVIILLLLMVTFSLSFSFRFLFLSSRWLFLVCCNTRELLLSSLIYITFPPIACRKFFFFCWIPLSIIPNNTIPYITTHIHCSCCRIVSNPSI